MALTEGDKGFELRCLNCGSINCIISPLGKLEDLVFEISCIDCGQGE